MNNFNFTDINRRALTDGYIKILLPYGKKTGKEIQAGDIYGNPGKSFCLNHETGAWIDNETGEKGGDIIALVAVRERLSQYEAAERLADELGLNAEANIQLIKAPDERTPVAGPPDYIHPYYNPDGSLAFKCQRWKKAGFKSSVRYPKKEDGYNPALLYNWPKAADSDSVCVVEGELCADKLTGVGYPAICNPGGAGQWLPEHSAYFKDKHIILLPDNDEAGQKHTQKILETIHQHAASVKVINLPDLPYKGDIIDWLEAGNDPAKLTAYIEIAKPVKGPQKVTPKNDYSMPPESLAHPGGKLEETMNIVQQSTKLNSHWILRLLTTMTAIGAIVGNKAIGQTGLKTNLYCMNLLPSGAGKGSQLGGINDIFRSAGLGDMLLPGHVTGEAALISAMQERQNNEIQQRLIDNGTGAAAATGPLDGRFLWKVDEFGDVLGDIKSGHVLKSGLSTLLKELFSSPDRNMPYTKGYAGDPKKKINIENPHLSIFTTGSQEKIFNVLSSADIADGFLARFMIVKIKAQREKKRKFRYTDPWKEQTELANWYKALSIQPAKVIEMTSEADDFFENWDDGIEKIINTYIAQDDPRAAIWSRASETAHKVAMIHAISLSLDGTLPWAIDIESAKYACEFAAWLANHMCAMFHNNINDTIFERVQKDIMSSLNDGESMTKAKIINRKRFLQKIDTKIVQDAFKRLVETNKIIEVHKKDKKAAYYQLSTEEAE